MLLSIRHWLAWRATRSNPGQRGTDERRTCENARGEELGPIKPAHRAAARHAPTHRREQQPETGKAYRRKNAAILCRDGKQEPIRDRLMRK
jgi:hypothetical protein